MVGGPEAEYFDRIKFSYPEADAPNIFDFQQALGFRYQPEIYLLDGNGNLLKKWVGYTTQVQFEEEFARHVN
jgi:hypothetical protein